MRFEVPQFIDVEDKIFGPFTFKQFIYLVGGAGLAYVSYKIIPFPIWPIVSLAFVILAAALTFYKLNNRTFIEIAQSWISYQIKGKRFIWKRTPVVAKQIPVAIAPKPQIVTKEVTAERIDTLAQNLDILDS